MITGQSEFLIRKSVKELEPKFFLKIYRGTIVTVSFIDRVSRMLTGGCILNLKAIFKPSV